MYMSERIAGGQYRQGDVLIVPVRSMPGGMARRERDGGRIVLAYGEVTGHAHAIFDVINRSYGNLYGFVPLTERQIDFYTKQYFPNVVPDYVKILLDEGGKPAGFVIGMPSLSRALQKAKGRL